MGFRYIGSKSKLIPKVIQRIVREAGTSAKVVDLMSGTGSVSLALKNADFNVISNDVMTYSYHHCRAGLHLGAAPPFDQLQVDLSISEQMAANDTISLLEDDKYLRVLQHLNFLEGKEGYFFREFSSSGRPANGVKPRNYFTAENAKRIDSIRSEIQGLKLRNEISDIEESLLIHDLILAANDIANIAGTYGHYLSKTVGRAKEPLRLTPTRFISKNAGDHHQVHRAYAEEVSAILSADLCYIDPPYIKRQYAANYHILETIARGDNPEAQGVSGLRPWRDQYSNFCTKTKIFDSFEKIIAQMDCDKFLISYSEDGLIPLDTLIAFFKKFGRVDCDSVEYKRFRSNNSSLAPTLEEYLIMIRK